MCARLTILLAHALGVAVSPRAIHGDFEPAEIAARFGAHVLEFSQFACERFRRESQRCPSVADSHDVTQCPLHVRTDSTGANMDRGMGFADGLRIALHRREFYGLAFETCLPPRPQF